MGSNAQNYPLIAIVGHTASGKSALAMDLAKRFNGEIICADSRTVYTGMDIGTAKPSAKDRKEIAHHLLDVSTPDHQITAAMFKKMAQHAIYDVASRGKIPILVGGTGLYIDAVLFDFSFRPVSSQTQREELERMSVKELQKILINQRMPLPSNINNPRHLIRQIETGGVAASHRPMRTNTLVIGVVMNKEMLQRQLAARLDRMIEEGLEQEVEALVKKYGWSCPALQTIGYQEFRGVSTKKRIDEDVRAMILAHSMQYAKRQKTWFKRNKHIHWISKKEDVVDLVTTFLYKTLPS